jgi:hypothetical protein
LPPTFPYIIYIHIKYMPGCSTFSPLKSGRSTPGCSTFRPLKSGGSTPGCSTFRPLKSGARVFYFPPLEITVYMQHRAGGAQIAFVGLPRTPRGFTRKRKDFHFKDPILINQNRKIHHQSELFSSAPTTALLTQPPYTQVFG